jgi:hypothetical protein
LLQTLREDPVQHPASEAEEGCNLAAAAQLAERIICQVAGRPTLLGLRRIELVGK